MPASLEGQLVVAISSRALFNLEEENRLFESGDTQGYMQAQLDRLTQTAEPGVAFSLVRKLLAFNQGEQRRVEVVLLSRNDPVSGMRIFRSAQAHGLSTIERGVFTQGADPFRYLRPLGAHLFLSANDHDVRQALALGFPAARVSTESMRAGDRHPHDERVLLTIAGVRDRDGRETTIELRRGEIVGLYGVVGSGCEAIAAEVAGLRRAKARRLALAGRPYRPASPAEAAAAGVGYLPSGRAANGIFPSMTVRDNLMLTQLRPLQRAGWVDVAAERRSAVAQLARMKTRMASAEAPITSLSGGNQQKVVIGRCIARGATLMVLEDPTAGIDVGAKHDIHQILRERAREGVAVLMVSSDLPETLQLCHTVYTVYDGCIVGVYREIRAILRMLGDYRYRMSWTVRMSLIAAIVICILSWLLISGLPFVGGLFDRVVLVVAVIVTYRTLSSELHRFQDALAKSRRGRI